ncbi:cilia- and flagella-associated protein 418 [Chanos chanos]|uniref:Cilia- and flagella-associated protein 418 n=1 Tax=Chanos chanos TaxID=29144 RepID=A0A6J2W426_CHACN|nr:protein C8orf37 homolog [Chanos chanos]
MADDLDDLLDEVETKFCCNTLLSAQPLSNFKRDQKCSQSEKIGSTSGATRPQTPKETDNEIENLIQEILEDEDYLPVSSDKSMQVTADSRNPLPQTKLRKCYPVFLGGSSVATGVGTGISQRACNELRCTSCDFRIAIFDDYEWDSSCDYLFFRNNMPDHHKLKAKLKRRKGARAYACQCSWHSALALTDLREQHQLKWVCGKH